MLRETRVILRNLSLEPKSFLGACKHDPHNMNDATSKRSKYENECARVWDQLGLGHEWVVTNIFLCGM